MTAQQVSEAAAELVDFSRAMWRKHFDSSAVVLTVRAVKQLWGTCPATPAAVDAEFAMAERHLGLPAASAAAVVGPAQVLLLQGAEAFAAPGRAAGKSLSEQLEDIAAIFGLARRCAMVAFCNALCFVSFLPECMPLWMHAGRLVNVSFLLVLAACLGTHDSWRHFSPILISLYTMTSLVHD